MSDYDIKEYPKRSDQQNRALHLWLTMIADSLNDAGFEQKITFGTEDVPWSKDSVKVIFRKIGKYQFEKKSTADLTTKEMQEVEQTFVRMLAEKGITPEPWPSIDQILNSQL